MKKSAFFKQMLKKTCAAVLTCSMAVGMFSGIGMGNADVKAAGKYNYATALQKSLIFYELQKSGKLDGPEFNRNNWRGDSCLNDGQDNGLDLTGGWFDAGDHVKFNLPMSYTACNLAWSYLMNTEAYEKSGQTKYLKNEVKWANDYFIKCHAQEGKYYFQVGSGSADHTYWGAAETVDARMDRPSYYVDATAENGGSAVCAETAASLAACAMVFAEDDPDYAATCLKHSKELLAMGEKAQSDKGYNVPADGFYHSWSGFYDEFCWANLWLYKATGEKEYLTKAESYVSKFNKQGQSDDIEYQYGQSWDDVHYSSCLFIAQIDGDSEVGKTCKKAIENNLDWWVAGAKKKSPGGLSWLSEWGSVRYATTSAFLAMAYAQWEDGDAAKRKTYEDWARSQAEYALGSSGQCFQVGYENDTCPRNVHHRTAHGTWLDGLNNEPETSRHLLVGALVGGCKAADDKYTDDRGDYYSNEVACDYNAGFTGLMAAMYEADNCTQPDKIDPNAGAYETPDDIPELALYAGINSKDDSENSKNNFIEIQARVENKTAWPARVTDDLSYRFFVDISDAIANGENPEDFTVRTGYIRENAKDVLTISGLKPYDEKNGIYYVEISLKGAVIYPGGQNYYRSECQFRIEAPGKWDFTKSPSYEGLAGSSANESVLAENMALYDGGDLVFGTEPDGTKPDPTTTRKTPTTQAPASTQTQAPASTQTQAPASTQTQAPTSTQPATSATQSNTTTSQKPQQSTTAPASTQAPSGGDENNTDVESSAGDDWLHTEGSNIVDKNGNVVRLTGANWFGFNCGERVLHGLWSADLRETIKACADRGINLLRIPISTELLLEWRDGKADKAGNFSNSPDWTFNPDLVNEDGTAMNTLQVMDKLMVLCKEYGVKVLIDCHSAQADNSGHVYPMWYNTEAGITTQDWIDGWKFIVDRYKDDDTFIAADLENEPHGKRDEEEYAKWDDTTDVNNWKYAAEQCANEILAINPNMLILVEGIEQNPKEGYTFADEAIKTNEGYVNYDGAWWGGNLRLVGDDPIDLKDAKKNSQIMYSPHDYGPSVYNQVWFDKDFTEQSLLDDYWYDAWAYLVEENISPLLMGEWGGHMDGGANEKWLNLLAEYMNKKNISHTFWCLNPNSGDTGGLLDSSFKVWDEEKYGLLKKTLWQTDDGQFIGLDHKISLGDNGLTVDEFYGTHTPGSTTQKPASTTQKPDATTENNNTTQNPDATTQQSGNNETTQNPDASTEGPDATTRKPSQTTQKPGDATEGPDVTTRRPSQTTQKPGDATEGPDATTRKPSQTTQKPGDATEGPDATTRKPSQTTQKPGDATEGPDATTRKPSQTTQKPGTSTEEPDSTTRKPAVTTEQPQTIPVKNILLPDVKTVYVGDKATLNAKVWPDNATNKSLTWLSDEPDIVTVDNKGNIEAKAVGTAVITVVSNDGNASAKCIVTVKEKVPDTVPVTSVIIQPEMNLVEEDVVFLQTTVVPDDATNKNLSYYSSDEKVATVDEDGYVYAISEGEATITVISEDGGKEATCKVIVEKQKAQEVAVDRIVMSQSKWNTKVNGKKALSVKIYPENATNTKVIWRSSNEAVATVDDNGNVVAVGEGNATIYAITANSKMDTCSVTVTKEESSDILAESVELDDDTYELMADESLTLHPVIYPENATNKEVMYISSNPEVASVDENGKVTAHSAGTSVITVIAVASKAMTKCRIVVLDIDEPDNTTETPGDNTGSQPGDNTGNKPGDNTGNKPGDNTGSQPGDNTGNKPGDNTGNKPGDNTGSQPGDNTGNKPGDNTGSQPGDNTGNKPGDNTGSQPGDNTGNKPGDNTGSQPGDNTGNKPGDNTGSQPGDNTGNKPGDNTGSKPDNTTQKPATTTNTPASTTQKPASTTQNPAVTANPTNKLISLVVGKQASVTVQDAGANQKVQYVSANSSIALVSPSGVITAKQPGVTKVSVLVDNVEKASYQVIVKPGAVKGLKKSLKKTKLQMKWTKQKGVSGYKVYVSSGKNGKYKLLKTVSKNTITVKNLKKNKEYRFKICAYKKSGNTKLTGSYSKTIKVKTGR